MVARMHAPTSAWRHALQAACPRALQIASVALAALLVGCASVPGGAGSGRDGPEANPPPELARVPDAEPKLEPIRAGGPNKPYEVLGQNYVPITQDKPFAERGLASWYGKKFHGKRTASGEVYNMYAMTAAHPTLPIPSYARIRNPANGREVVVRVNDRGPFHPGRIVDLSYTAALKLDLLRGVAPVELTRITFDDIRTGAWRRGTSDAPVQLAGGAAPPVRAAVAVPETSVVTVATTAPAAETSAASDSAGSSAPAPTTPAASIDVAAASTSSTSSAASAPPPNVVSAAPLTDAPAARAYTTPQRGFWIQLGAFRERGGAESFQGRVATELDWLSPLLAVFGDASLFKLQAGPYPSRDEARTVAERVRVALKLVPVIVERR